METFLATTGQIFLRLLEMYGIDANKFVRDGGYAPEVFRDPSARLPSSAVDVAARAAAERISDPAFALGAARCWHPSNLGAFGHAWLASSTLRTGLQRLVRYGRILGEKAKYRLEDTGKGLRIVFDHGRKNLVLGALGTDYALSILMDMCRMNFGAALRTRCCRSPTASSPPPSTRSSPGSSPTSTAPTSPHAARPCCWSASLRANHPKEILPKSYT